MKIPVRTISLETALLEFDIWITPSLGEIRDTDRFQEELTRICSVFEALATATDNFATVESCQPATIAKTYATLASRLVDPEVGFYDLASTLFLVTGKSDNNAKCQLPIFLRDRAKFGTFPRLTRGKIVQGSIPRVLKSEDYMAVVAALSSSPELQSKLLEAFVGFVLSDDRFTAQLWSVGRSFVVMKEIGRHLDLLSPLVAFQVRGSVSASGGHEPEEKLREMMTSWGLIRDRDFNTSDAAVDESEQAVEGDEKQYRRIKTRSYDFILPFKTPKWKPRLFFQCQFYAGDSGSVSHKNVDQTSQSRGLVAKAVERPRFIECVDGAGYFSSLNGDLKHILGMRDTRSFVQLKSAPIRLRRELQDIGFLTPLDLAHASLQGSGRASVIDDLLQRDGYSRTEIKRALAQSIEVGLLERDEAGHLRISQARRTLVRQYFLLDVAAIHGGAFDPARESLSGKFLIPGYGPFFGLPLDALASRAMELAPAFGEDWRHPSVILADIKELCDRGYAMTG